MPPYISYDVQVQKTKQKQSIQVHLLYQERVVVPSKYRCLCTLHKHGEFPETKVKP